MTDDQQRARELLPCPFCGYAMAEEEDGAYQNDGFVGPQTPVWLVTCPDSACNASVFGTSKESAMAAWNRRAALRAAPEGFVLVPVSYRSVFHDKCWRCYPSFCKCPPTKDEVEAMKGELYLLDQALQREQMRSRVMAGELAGLAQAVLKAKTARLDAGGYDNLPKDLFDLAEKAGHAALAARPQGVK